MSRKRIRMLIGRDNVGNTQTIMTGLFSVSDIRYWAGFFHLIVKGTHKGQDYCWQLLKTKVVENNPESCSVPGVGNPPKNKINTF